MNIKVKEGVSEDKKVLILELCDWLRSKGLTTGQARNILSLTDEAIMQARCEVANNLKL